MTLAELLTPDRVIAEMRSDEQIPAVVELVDHLVAHGGLAAELRDPALSALKAREEQRSTGIGGGVAIPHCFLPGLESVTAVFGRSVGGIDFCALDRAPVHFAVLFMVPDGQHTLHLKTLAAIARILNSAETRSRLSEATGKAELLEILTLRTATA